MRAIAKFLLATFAITWALWALVIWSSASRQPSPAPIGLALGGPVFLLGVFAPGIVAIALTALDEDRRAVGNLLGRVLRWRVDLRFYAFALLLMPVTKLTVAALHRALTGVWPRFGETHAIVLVAATIFGTIGQAGEEIGWRGYLLPRLAERIGLASASLLVGAVWAAWHLPLFFAAGADTDHQSFLLYALQVTAYSVTLAWLYWRTGGSLLLTMFMHSAFNNTKDIVPSVGAASGGVFTLRAPLAFQLTVIALWLAAALLLTRMRGVRPLVAPTFNM